MVWFRADDGLIDNRKVRQLRHDKRAAMGVWLLAGVWSGRNLRDGFVPDDVLDELDEVTKTGGHRYAQRLIDVGLWARVEASTDGSGYQFHDWGQCNPMAADVLLDREKTAERQRKSRQKRRSDAGQFTASDDIDVTDDVTRDRRRDSQGASHGSHAEVAPYPEPEPEVRAFRGGSGDHVTDRERDKTDTSTNGHRRSAATTQTILTEWCVTGKRSKQLTADVRGQVKSFFDQGFDGAHIREAVQRWSAKGNIGAGALPAFLNEVVNGNGSKVNGHAPTADPGVEFDALRKSGDAKGASRLIDAAWREPSQPLSDHTPSREWLHVQRVAWIDEHADGIRSALMERAR